MDSYLERICTALEVIAAKTLTADEWRSLKITGLLPPPTEEQLEQMGKEQAAMPEPKTRKPRTPKAEAAPAPTPALPPGVDVTNLRQKCREAAMALADKDRARLDKVLATFGVQRLSEIDEGKLAEFMAAIS